MDRHYTYTVVTQYNSYSSPFDGKVIVRDAPGGMHDIIYRQETPTSSSMRPIVHQVLDRELLLLAQMRDLLNFIPHRCIKQIRVDSLLAQSGERNIKESKAFHETTWACLNGEEREGLAAFKTEKLYHGSSAIITVGEFDQTCNGKMPELKDPWWDLTEEEAWEHAVEDGGSLFISGLPGVGESHLCMMYVEEIKKKRRVFLCDPTHVAARNLRCEGLKP